MKKTTKKTTEAQHRENGTVSKKPQAPFPWFGRKHKVAAEVWKRFGNVANYVEPFFGSGAVLLGKPSSVECKETVNDIDGFIANFWRSIKLSPELTAQFADNPVNENDLHARHIWLVHQIENLTEKLNGDPDYHDPKIAGYWVWGVCCWIGGGFCSGTGPWGLSKDGRLVKDEHEGMGISRRLPCLSNKGMGINRQLPHLGSKGQGILEWFSVLSARLCYVRVASGDWSRICGPSVTTLHGLTALFLDPPYADPNKKAESAYRSNVNGLADDVRRFAIENGNNPLLRIALCGYKGEHLMPGDWTEFVWNAGPGYAATTGGWKGRERIWFSPHCLKIDP
jgi:hypothetical protein